MKQKKALLKQLGNIKDFREHEGKIIYPLSEIIFITLFGILKGYTTFNIMSPRKTINFRNIYIPKW